MKKLICLILGHDWAIFTCKRCGTRYEESKVSVWEIGWVVILFVGVLGFFIGTVLGMRLVLQNTDSEGVYVFRTTGEFQVCMPYEPGKTKTR